MCSYCSCQFITQFPHEILRPLTAFLIVLSKVLVTVHVPVSQKFDLFHILKSLEHMPLRLATTALFQNETHSALKNKPVNLALLSALPRFAGILAILIQILWGCAIIFI